MIITSNFWQGLYPVVFLAMVIVFDSQRDEFSDDLLSSESTSPGLNLFLFQDFNLLMSHISFAWVDPEPLFSTIFGIIHKNLDFLPVQKKVASNLPKTMYVHVHYLSYLQTMIRSLTIFCTCDHYVSGLGDDNVTSDQYNTTSKKGP